MYVIIRYMMMSDVGLISDQIFDTAGLQGDIVGLQGTLLDCRVKLLDC